MANTNRIAKVIKTAEAKALEDTAGARDEIAALTLALPAYKAKAQDIEDGLSAEDEVKSRMRKGEEVTAMDLLAARAEDEMAAMRLKYAQHRYDTLNISLPVDSPILAEAIAPAFRAVLPTVEVITTTVPIRFWQRDIPEGTTAVVLVENKGMTESMMGVKDGSVTAYFIRHALYRPIDVESLERAAAAARVSLTVKSNKVGDENGWQTVAGNGNGNQSDPNTLVVDTLHVSVAGVVDGLPVIRKADGTGGPVKSWVMETLASQIDRTIIRTSGVVDDREGLRDGLAFRIRLGSSTVQASKPTFAEQIDGNERTVVATQVLNLTSINPPHFIEKMRHIADEWMGSPMVGLGLIESVQFTGREGQVRGNYPVEVQITYKSLTA